VSGPSDREDNQATRHPARFTPAVLDAIAEQLGDARLVLDPFAGTGRIHQLADQPRLGGPLRVTIGVELEPEWAAMHPRTIVGNALALPFPNATFDAVATSPCYGNRLADHHDARDGSVRRSYTHDLGRPLHPHNAGALQWGEPYRDFHRRAWLEAVRVLRPGGVLLLNVSDHIRGGRRIPVTDWHAATLVELGLHHGGSVPVRTPRLRYGANATARTDSEVVLRFRKPLDEDNP
jgi:SAM-dependent methyltransferase